MLSKFGIASSQYRIRQVSFFYGTATRRDFAKRLSRRHPSVFPWQLGVPVGTGALPRCLFPDGGALTGLSVAVFLTRQLGCIGNRYVHFRVLRGTCSLERVTDLVRVAGLLLAGR